jgi:hypothetical protein
MNQQEKKGNARIGFIGIALVISILYWIGKSESPAKQSGEISHACLHCSKTYTGNGWMTLNGDQYQATTDNGNQYCSSACAYNSQSQKWKNSH